jgi:hypothetical protein
MRFRRGHPSRRSHWWFAFGFLAAISGTGEIRAQLGPAEGREGLVELGKDDPRLKGHYAPKGCKVQVIAAEPTIVDPTGMAFDDQGNLYVAQWKNADHMYDTWETLKLPEGGTTKVLRRRKATTDVVKRLFDRDHDGVYQAWEIGVDGAAMPARIFPSRNSLYLTCVGCLERWSDEDGDGQTHALPIKENHWRRVLRATDGQLLEMLRGRDDHEARRALRELVKRGPAQRGPLLALLNDTNAPLNARLLGLQGARQLWDQEVEAALCRALDDLEPDVRSLAAQALDWEPRERRAALVPVLVAHLNDDDGRALRDIALALGRHGGAQPGLAALTLLSWLLNHPSADVVIRDGFIRAIERLGSTGVEAVAQLIRAGTAAERAQALAIFTAFRSAAAAQRLPELAQGGGLTSTERLALVRQFKDIPLNIPVPTKGLAEFVIAHSEFEPPVKVAALDVCRLAGNPAPALVEKLLDDSDLGVRLAATKLAAQSRHPEVLERLRERVADPKRTAEERITIAQALRGTGQEGFSALEAAYNTFPDDASFRAVVLRAAADADRVKATPLCEAALVEGAPEVCAVAIEVLSDTPQSALKLGPLYDLAPDELADLLAFLQSKPAQETLRNERPLSQFVAIGPFGPGPDESHVPLDRVDSSHSYLGEEGRSVTWAPLESDGGGTVALRGQLGLNGARAYLATHLRSESAQDAALSYSVDGACRVYLNGAKVAETPALGGRQRDRALAHVLLRPGWNTLVVAVDRAAIGADRSWFRLNAAQPVEVRPQRPN